MSYNMILVENRADLVGEGAFGARERVERPLTSRKLRSASKCRVGKLHLTEGQCFQH